MRLRWRSVLAFALTILALALAGQARGNPDEWLYEWPRTDFSQHAVPYEEIRSGGPPKDGIPAIDDPLFVPVAEIVDLAPQEPVISIALEGDARAYPLRVLTWHEIVKIASAASPSPSLIARFATPRLHSTGASTGACLISAPPASSAIPIS